MKLLSVFALSLALGLGSAALSSAQDAPPTPPAKPMKMPRLTQPWSKMGSLTPEQKMKIGEIHKKANDDKKAIDAKEQEDILALLSPEQKAEVDKIIDDGTAAKKGAKPAAKTAPATQPDAGGM